MKTLNDYATESHAAMAQWWRDIQTGQRIDRNKGELLALIRIFDYAGGFGLDLEGAYREKMAFNATRNDHSHEHRSSENGKKF